jgi:hypothetical protein
MLVDRHAFVYTATVPWPAGIVPQLDWIQGVELVESWLQTHVGKHYVTWAWNDSKSSYQLGVAFKWDQDRSIFVLTWAR